MGYFLNSICIKQETDFEKVEKLYHEQCYGDYESLKRKNSGKLYDTVKVKYFPLPKDCCFCIFDEDNADISENAKKLSIQIDEAVISVQIFDSDELEIKAFKKGRQVSRIHKDHKDCAIEGDISVICDDEENCVSVLKDDYVFMEDCAEKLLPQKVIFPQERITEQKIVKYQKEIFLPLETEKLPLFELYGWCSPTKESKKFSCNITNCGKKSTGLIVMLKGSAIQNKNIVVKKAFFSLFGSREQIECSDTEMKEHEGESLLIYRFNDVTFPAGYNKEIISKLFKTNNMDLYRKLLEFKIASTMTLSFDCEVNECEGKIEAYVYPNENLEDGAICCIMELENPPYMMGS